MTDNNNDKSKIPPLKKTILMEAFVPPAEQKPLTPEMPPIKPMKIMEIFGPPGAPSAPPAEAPHPHARIRPLHPTQMMPAFVPPPAQPQSAPQQVSPPTAQMPQYQQPQPHVPPMKSSVPKTDPMHVVRGADQPPAPETTRKGRFNKKSLPGLNDPVDTPKVPLWRALLGLGPKKPNP